MSEEGERGKQEAGTNLQGGSLNSKRLTVKTDSDVKHDDQPKEVAVKFEPHKSSVLSMKVQRKVYPCTRATWERRKIALLPATRPHKIHVPWCKDETGSSFSLCQRREDTTSRRSDI